MRWWFGFQFNVGWITLKKQTISHFHFLPQTIPTTIHKTEDITATLPVSSSSLFSSLWWIYSKNLMKIPKNNIFIMTNFLVKNINQNYDLILINYKIFYLLKHKTGSDVEESRFERAFIKRHFRNNWVNI